MCLTRITKRYKEPTKRARVAYKILYGAKGYGYQTPYIGVDITEGEWKSAQKTELKTDNWENCPSFPASILGKEIYKNGRELYTSGFHVFATRKGAEKAARLLQESPDKIVKVKVRGVSCEGMDGTDRAKEYIHPGIKTLVADEIYIPKEK